MSLERTGIITFSGNPLTLLGPEIKIGMQAPDFDVLTPELTLFSLKDAGSGVKIISVVPSIDTPVCNLQTSRFNHEAASLQDVQILTISVDLPFALGRYCAAQGIDKIKTLSDHRELSFGLSYGFVIKELRLLSRGIVVLDKNNVVQHIEYVNEITTEPNYDAALEKVKQLV